MAYYTKKELTNIGLDGFALIDQFYGNRKGGRKQQLPNYGAANARPLPPPPAAATTPVVARNHYSTASTSGYSRRVQYQGYNYRYSPSESHVGWAPVVAVTAETTTVIRGGYEAGDADILMDKYKSKWLTTQRRSLQTLASTALLSLINSTAVATPVVARNNHYSTASSSGYSRRVQYQQGYNYRYSPSESHVGWAPVVAVTAETTTVIRGGYEASDAEMLIMDKYKY
nr:uncharacterized protein LOC109176261 [Ipomoea trifida]